jgi:hypothetical protein
MMKVLNNICRAGNATCRKRLMHDDMNEPYIRVLVDMNSLSLGALMSHLAFCEQQIDSSREMERSMGLLSVASV